MDNNIKGTIARTRDREKLVVKSVVIDAKPPSTLNAKYKKLWEELLPELEQLKLANYHMPTLKLAFETLQDIEEFKKMRKKAKDIKEYCRLSELINKYVSQYNTLMIGFFGNPKERSKFILETQQAVMNEQSIEKKENKIWKLALDTEDI